MNVPVPKLRMGKYKGRRYDQVPVDYLKYMLTLPNLWPQTRELIEFYLGSKQQAQQAQPEKKQKLDYNPPPYKPKPSGVRTEAGKERFRVLTRQMKEKVFGHA